MESILQIAFGAALVWAIVWLRSRFISFRGQRPEEFLSGVTDFDLKTHLNGPMTCEGVIFGPTGRVASRFTADLHVNWDGDTGFMEERFYYDSGAVQDRSWSITIGEGGSVSATAPDVIGTGTGKARGPALQLKYRIRLDQDAGGHILKADDWMYLVGDGTIINRSQFRKFGLLVAELVAAIRPKETE